MKEVFYLAAIITILLVFLYLHNTQSSNNNNLKKRIINFFEEMGYKYQPPAPIRSKSYGPNNDYYIYSTAQVIKENAVMVQPIVRKEDQGSSNPFRLSNFNMISVKNEVNLSKMVDTSIKFMRDFCGIDMGKIGCVSISGNNRFGFEGIENYIRQLENGGINKKNIYIRDADEAVNEGAGDGYWKDPDFSEYNSWSISFYYQLENGANIAEYKNYNKWLEIGEIGDNDFGFGFERIKYVMERNRR